MLIWPFCLMFRDEVETNETSSLRFGLWVVQILPTWLVVREVGDAKSVLQAE